MKIKYMVTVHCELTTPDLESDYFDDVENYLYDLPTEELIQNIDVSSIDLVDWSTDEDG